MTKSAETGFLGSVGSANISKSGLSPNRPWKVDLPATVLGKRQRKFFLTKGDALRWVDEFEESLKNHGRIGVQMSGTTVGDILERFYTAKDLKGDHRRLAHFFLDKFIEGRRAVPISLIGPSDLERFWNNGKWSGTTKAQAYRYIALFFGWAERYDFVERNPARRVERPKADKPKKTIITPDDLRKLLKLSDDLLKPYLCLGAFAGLRTSEILAGPKISTEEIFTSGKTGERFVKILPAFARHWPKKEFSPPDERTFRRHREKLVAAMEWQEWPGNCLRHSFASYHLAMWEDAPKTAFQMGHSNPQMVYRAYARAVSKTSASEWWKC